MPHGQCLNVWSIKVDESDCERQCAAALPQTSLLHTFPNKEAFECLLQGHFLWCGCGRASKLSLSYADTLGLKQETPFCQQDPGQLLERIHGGHHAAGSDNTVHMRQTRWPQADAGCGWQT